MGAATQAGMHVHNSCLLPGSSVGKRSKQKRSKRFHTPVGTIELIRRAYLENGHYVCKAGALLGLPESGWFVQTEELACVLGVSAEFIHACELLAKTTGIELSDHGLANRVNALGQLVHEHAQAEPTQEVYPLERPCIRRSVGVSCPARLCMWA